MAVIFARVADKFDIALPSKIQVKPFADEALISLYARAAVYAMQQADVISGRPSGLFDPKGTATRAEAAKVMYGVLSLTGMIGGN